MAWSPAIKVCKAPTRALNPEGEVEVVLIPLFDGEEEDELAVASVE
jgi:hypothetical protein